MSKKIYISLPITGTDIPHTKTKALVIADELKRKGYTPVTPFKNGLKDNSSYESHMSKDIKLLLQCDVVYFCEGWQNSKGCMLEFMAAKIYDKEILFD